MSYEDDKDILTEDFLMHFGVKGMRWGHRTGGTDGRDSGRPPSNRQLNKASRAKDREASKAEEAQRKLDVIAARERVYGKHTKADLQAAKEQFKSDKLAVGSREARKTLNEARNKAYEDFAKSQEYLNGKEFMKDLALTAIPYVGTLAPLVRERSLRKQYGGSK